MAGNEILTVTAAAVELRCSKAHVFNAIAGKVRGVTPLPAISMGRRRLVRRAEQMGHTVDVNENVYTFTSLKRRKDAVNALEKAIGA